MLPISLISRAEASASSSRSAGSAGARTAAAPSARRFSELGCALGVARRASRCSSRRRGDQLAAATVCPVAHLLDRLLRGSRSRCRPPAGSAVCAILDFTAAAAVDSPGCRSRRRPPAPACRTSAAKSTPACGRKRWMRRWRRAAWRQGERITTSAASSATADGLTATRTDRGGESGASSGQGDRARRDARELRPRRPGIATSSTSVASAWPSSSTQPAPRMSPRAAGLRDRVLRLGSRRRAGAVLQRGPLVSPPITAPGTWPCPRAATGPARRSSQFQRRRGARRADRTSGARRGSGAR